MTETPAHTPLEKPKLSRARLVLMAVVVILAGGVLAYLKSTAGEEKAQIVATAEATKTERAEAQIAIGKAIVALHGGVSRDAKQSALVAKVAQAFTSKTDAQKSAVPLKFTLLAEPNAINLYALPGGDIYLTTALLNRMQTEGQLAAVLAHGIAHVMAADELSPVGADAAKAKLWSYSVADERKADQLTLTLMAQAGYDPNALIGMFSVLANAYQAKADVPFFTTHPNEEQRLQQVQAGILALYPNGVPAVLSK